MKKSLLPEKTRPPGRSLFLLQGVAHQGERTVLFLQAPLFLEPEVGAGLGEPETIRHQVWKRIVYGVTSEMPQLL